MSTFLILLSLIPLTTQTTIQINQLQSIHTTDEKFASFTIDASQWRKMNLSSTKLRFLAKQLQPSVLRVGGTQEDYDIYQFGSFANFNCKDVLSPMTTYRCKTINQTQWRSLVNFANTINASLVYGLNDLFGRPTKTKPETKQCNDNCPPRNMSNVEAFLKWNIKNMPLDTVHGWELGNELNSYFNSNKGAKEQSKDLRTLRSLVDDLYNETEYKPLIIGPDTHSSAEFSKIGLEWLNTFSQASFTDNNHNHRNNNHHNNDNDKSNAIDILTFHMYSMGNGPKLDPNNLNASFLNAAALDKSGAGARAVSNVVKKYSKSTAIWAGETASANNGGQTGITDTFCNGFWYLDQLGSHAAAGVDVVCRQTLENSGGYPLIENLDPLPDYWLIVLWKQIMGIKVLNVTSIDNVKLRAYAHCSAATATANSNNGNNGSISIAWLNIGDKSITLDLPEMNKDGAILWILQPGKKMNGMHNPLQSQEMKLNGIVLDLKSQTKNDSFNYSLPNLNGIKIKSGQNIVVPSASYGFLTFPNAKAKACGFVGGSSSKIKNDNNNRSSSSSQINFNSVVAANFEHTWETSAAMTFADMSAPKILTDKELLFVSSHYRIFSMEKCSGRQSGNTTEEYIYSTASRLKQLDSTTKTIFYWATDQQGIWCYNAATTFNNKTNWHFLDDNGIPVSNGNGPVLDFTNPEAAEWWISTPLAGDDGNGNWQGIPVATILDGVLADGAHRPNYKNVSANRLNALGDAKFLAIQTMQTRFTKLNNGKVMANGIDMYPAPNNDPRYNDHNLHVLNVAGAIMNEHTAAFESVHFKNATYNYQRVKEDLNAIDRAASMDNGSRTVFVQTWPGMYSGVEEYPPVSNGGEKTPKTNDEWRDALIKHFPFAHALALIVAEKNVYWFYGGTWYSQNTGFIPCPEDPKSCRAPSEANWYPDLKKKLGPPLGKRKEIAPNIWTRKFEYADVYLDLVTPHLSNVTFHLESQQPQHLSNVTFHLDSQQPHPPTGCPLYQCDPAGTNRITSTTQIATTKSSKQRLLWSRNDVTFQSLSKFGCVSNSINIICAPERSNSTDPINNNSIISSLDSEGNILYQLNVGPSIGEPIDSPSIALLDPESSFFWNDAAHILLGNAKGDVLWTNTFADNVKGDFYPATITTGSPTAPFEVLVVAMLNGFLFSYNTEGIPVAGVNLADNTTTPFATYVPVAAPITVGYRVFIVARSKSLTTPSLGRLYAYDVRDVAVDRMKLAWYVEFDRYHDNNEKTFNQFGSLMEPGTVIGNTDMICIGKKKTEDKIAIFLMKNVTLATSSNDVKVVAITGTHWTKKTASTDVVVVADQKGTGAWVISQTEADLMYHVDSISEAIDRTINVKKLLLDLPKIHVVSKDLDKEKGSATKVVLTSRLTGFDCVEYVSCVVASFDGVVVLISLLNTKPEIVWKWKVPNEEIVTGQLAIVPMSKSNNSSNVVVIRTKSGVYGLQL